MCVLRFVIFRNMLLLKKTLNTIERLVQLHMCIPKLASKQLKATTIQTKMIQNMSEFEENARIWWSYDPPYKPFKVSIRVQKTKETTLTTEKRFKTNKTENF